MAGITGRPSAYEFQQLRTDKKRPYSSIPNLSAQQMPKRSKPDALTMDDSLEVHLSSLPLYVSSNLYVCYPYIYTEIVSRGIEINESVTSDCIVPHIVYIYRKTTLVAD